MSFVHVENCAAQHVSAMESDGASGRYFSLVESWHWNDILVTLKEIYPGLISIRTSCTEGQTS